MKQRDLLPAVLASLAGLPYPVVVVEGAHQLDAPPGARLVHCDDWADGPGASLRCGLEALPSSVERAAVVLADGPELDPRAVERLLAHEAPIAAATYDGVARSHPVVLARAVWAAVPDEGARALDPVLVDCRDLRAPGDVDVKVSGPMPAEGRISLGDGGTAAWCEWGEPGGRPVVLLHGTPGSRLFLADPAGHASAGLRVLTFDRPGYGLSTAPAVPTLAGIARIVERLADERGLERFSVIGFSGGVPGALACGAILGSRVSRVAAVSGGGPIDELAALSASLSDEERDLVNRIRADPEGAHELLWELGAWYPETPLRMLDTSQEEPDESIFDDPVIRANFAAANLEGARQGQAGLVADWTADALPWGFALGEISVPVDIWVGGRDPGRAPLDAPEIGRRIPRGSVHTISESAHWLLVTHWQEIVGVALS